MDIQQSTSELERNEESASSLSLSSERLDDGVLGIVALAMDSITHSSSSLTSERTEAQYLRTESQSLRTDTGQWSTASEAATSQQSSTLPLHRLRSSSHGQESSVDPDSSALSLDSSNGSTSQGDLSQADLEGGLSFVATESVLMRTSSRTDSEPPQGGTPLPGTLTGTPSLTVERDSSNQSGTGGSGGEATSQQNQEGEEGICSLSERHI